MSAIAKTTIAVALILSLGIVSFAADGPELTDLQKLRIERINLVNENAALTKENVDLKLQLAALKVSIEKAQLQQEIEREHPGFTWDPSTGQFAPKGPNDGELR